MTNEERIAFMHQRLKNDLLADPVKITDDSAKHIGHEGAKGGAGHFSLEIASPLFQGKSLVACHRLVYDTLAELIPNEVHALKIRVV